MILSCARAAGRPHPVGAHRRAYFGVPALSFKKPWEAAGGRLWYVRFGNLRNAPARRADIPGEIRTMSLAGLGAVAIWHDIAPEGRGEFYAWHGHQHMPERTGIPGFLRGRRYVAIDGAPEFFNLYETVSRATVAGPDYLARLNAPTPWTTATVRHFRSVARSLCEVAASFGDGQGGLMATFRYAVDNAAVTRHRSAISQSTLPKLAAEPGVAGCHLLIADEAASAVETAERRLRSEQNIIPRCILLVESWDDVGPFRELCQRVVAGALFGAAPAFGLYRLQNSRSRAI
jgi:hypothetical protein